MPWRTCAPSVTPPEAARPHLTAELGAHRPVRRFPLGPRRRYRRRRRPLNLGRPADRRMTFVFYLVRTLVVEETDDGLK